ncbi:hypothetical protein [Alicyclobacillus sp. ALC3]|uniref:hypothetical protein n=1 Tax=Alicyclobacillus sp. ALC3 TaxID=2796143 RepID=UPI0023790DA0|nr:hypothetical protein [Alicyclobacillus sp. ALC3]WDL96918.1 hypothetical protein JC200_22005 [Alicyclobacillus sp. ALC3]
MNAHDRRRIAALTKTLEKAKEQAETVRLYLADGDMDSQFKLASVLDHVEIAVERLKEKQDDRSQGQRDYEADLKRKPTYHDGTPRPQWSELDLVARWSWERGPNKPSEVTT